MIRICLPLCLLSGLLAAQDVASSPHNLSASGPGPVRAATESEICIFCHAPHDTRPQAPLWNRRDPGGAYTTYTSSTLKVAPGQPSGASRLCLSCHDGTIALGEVLSRPQEIGMVGSRTMPPGRSLIGIDLSDDHPISFSYAESHAAAPSELRADPALYGRSLLDPAGAVQCTACHDAHDNSRGNFMRTDPANGDLCLACHQPSGWTGSSHASSSATWNGTGADPWPNSDLTTVGGNACGSCHVPHSARGRERILTSDAEEEVCLVCHNGNVAGTDIATEMQKWSSHNGTGTKGVHEPAETPDGRATHVECVDCHNPHWTSSEPGGAGALPGSLRGVPGLDASGDPVAQPTYEYEICFKCHSDDASSHPDRIPRIATQKNIRRAFDPANPSYHPVVAAGKNPDVPSLKTAYTAASIIRCTDCHNNDVGPGAGGAGTKGPHGSRWDFLLERQYVTLGETSESSQTYAMCYKCHSRTSILNNESFRHHDEHKDYSCAACHDPHGIDQSVAGSAGDNTHLINFDTRVVAPNSRGLLEFRDLGRFAGTCSLRCHGEDHDDERYGN